MTRPALGDKGASRVSTCEGTLVPLCQRPPQAAFTFQRVDNQVAFNQTFTTEVEYLNMETK